MKNKPKKKLMPFQREGARQIKIWKGKALLADEMGLGKTIQALYYIWKCKKSRPAVILCPSSLKLNWAEEAEGFGLRSFIASGKKAPARGRLFMHDYDLIIINYQILEGWVDFLISLEPKIVVIEEGHYIKNIKSKRYKATKKLAIKSNKRIGITGTPLTNRPIELWSLLNLIRPDLFSNYFEFAHTYCNPKKTRWGMQFKGAKNLDKLHAILKKHVMIRRQKKDVLKDLPAKNRSVVPLELSNRRDYDQAEKDFKQWVRVRFGKSKASAASKSEALMKIGYLLRLAADLKLPQAFEWIDNFLVNSNEKLVIFTGFKKTIQALMEKYGEQAVMIDGSVPSHLRQGIVKKFQEDKNIRLFFGNHIAAGVGLTLTESSTVLHIDLPWTPGDLNQCDDRVHRITQKRPVFIYYMVAKGTIEEKKCDALRKKQIILDKVLDGGQIKDNSDVFSDLLLSYG